MELGTYSIGMVSMPEILRSFPGAQVFGTIWFLLLFFAAFTSSVGVAQPVMAFLQDELKIKRGAAAVRDSEIFLMGGWEGKRSARATAIKPGTEEFAITVLDDLPRGFSDTALIAYNGELVLIGGNHPRFKRQIGFLMIDPDTGMSEDVKFRSFLFW